MKQYAILSDIHGNSWALEAVLEDMSTRQIDTILNLGDILYGPLDPAGTFELLASIEQIAIQGNQDRVMVEPVEDSNPTLEYVLDSLSAEQMGWIRDLPQTAALDADVFLCHGTPENDSIYLLESVDTGHPIIRSDKVLLDMVEGIDASVIVCGHSHVRHWVMLSSGQFILNPGSVGLPAYDDNLPVYHKMQAGSPYASYAILTVHEGQSCVEFIQIPYDWNAAADAARKNGREDWAVWLQTGRA